MKGWESPRNLPRTTGGGYAPPSGETPEQLACHSPLFRPTIEGQPCQNMISTQEPGSVRGLSLALRRRCWCCKRAAGPMPDRPNALSGQELGVKLSAPHPLAVPSSLSHAVLGLSTYVDRPSTRVGHI